MEGKLPVIFPSLDPAYATRPKGSMGICKSCYLAVILRLAVPAQDGKNTIKIFPCDLFFVEMNHSAFC